MPFALQETVPQAAQQAEAPVDSNKPSVPSGWTDPHKAHTVPAGWPKQHRTTAECAQTSNESEWLAWCEMFHAPLEFQVHKVNMLQNMFKECEWKAWQEGELEIAPTAAQAPGPVDLAAGSPPYRPVTGWTQEYCQSGDWTFNRLGPITTNGGYSWQNYFMDTQTPGER